MIRVHPSSRPPLTYHSAIRRLVIVGALLGAGSTAACWQDKPPAASPNAKTASDAPSASAQLGLQPVPATHDTAIREIDRFQLTPEGLERYMQAKRAIDSLHATNPEIEQRMRAAVRPKTVDEAGKRFDDEPKMHDALKASGLSGKNFLLSAIAIQQAMKGYQLKSMGKLDVSKVPPVIMGNINFVGAHIAQIMSLVTAAPQRPAAP